ncbi:MAG TPA: VTT domain-containing protein [Bryobacteraceae bacterium]|nr:VTT domain-containing protein [Bryobacteraceae bacterium]
MKALLSKLSATLVAYGPWGIFVLSVIDSCGIPLPAAMDVLLIGLAAGSVKHPERAIFAALMAIVGSTGGNIALFLAARRGAGWMVKEQPSLGRGQRFRDWFSRYGLLTVFVPAVTPVPPLPLKVFVVTAGALRTSKSRFVGTVLLARSIRFFAEIYLGLMLGKDAEGFLARNGWTLGGLAIGLGVACYLLARWMESRRQAGAGIA